MRRRSEEGPAGRWRQLALWRWGGACRRRRRRIENSERVVALQLTGRRSGDGGGCCRDQDVQREGAEEGAGRLCLDGEVKRRRCNGGEAAA